MYRTYYVFKVFLNSHKVIPYSVSEINMCPSKHVKMDRKDTH